MEKWMIPQCYGYWVSRSSSASATEALFLAAVVVPPSSSSGDAQWRTTSRISKCNLPLSVYSCKAQSQTGNAVHRFWLIYSSRFMSSSSLVVCRNLLGINDSSAVIYLFLQIHQRGLWIWFVLSPRIGVCCLVPFQRDCLPVAALCDYICNARHTGRWINGSPSVQRKSIRCE